MSRSRISPARIATAFLTSFHLTGIAANAAATQIEWQQAADTCSAKPPYGAAQRPLHPQPAARNRRLWEWLMMNRTPTTMNGKVSMSTMPTHIPAEWVLR